MSKQRIQANKQKQSKTKHVTQMKSSSLSGGLYPFRDEAPSGYLNLLRLLIYKDFYAPLLFPDIIHSDLVSGYLNLLRLLIYKDFYAPPRFLDIIHLDSVNLGIIPH
jgi:hypothetical protein